MTSAERSRPPEWSSRFGADAAFWRKLAWWGAAKGPRRWLRHSPTPIGVAFALGARGQRAHVMASLRDVLGERSAISEQLDVARVFVQFAHALAESLALSGSDRYRPVVDVPRSDELSSLLRGGRGVVVATAHTAGWELALRELHGVASVPIAVAMLPEREAVARDFHPEVGGRGPVRVVPVGDDPLSALPLLAHLRSGGAVALQIDRCPRNMRGIDVTVGSKTWTLPAGPFVLAATSGAPLALVLSRRTAFMRYRLVVHSPLTLPRRATDDDLHRAARIIASHLTEFVRSHPDQWFDFAPR